METGSDEAAKEPIVRFEYGKTIIALFPIAVKFDILIDVYYIQRIHKF